MYFDRILHFAVVSQIVPLMIASTIFSLDKKSNRLEIGISLTATNSKSNETWNIVGKIVAASSDVPEPCRCVLPHLCKPEDRSTEKEQCPDSRNVCCRPPLISIATDQQPIELFHISEGSLAINGGPECQTQLSLADLHVDNTSQSDCICVQSNQCADPLVASAGAGQIDRTVETRFSCISPDICCPQESIVQGEASHASIETSVTEPNPNSMSSSSTAIPPTIQKECGVRNPSIDNRISAPEHLAHTSFGEFPWMALILTNETGSDGTVVQNVFVCGASLLSPSIVLTAAHCVANLSRDSLIIRVGEYDTHLGVSEPMLHQDRSVLEISVHNEFNHRALYNDIALIRVTEDFVLAYHVSPVCVPSPFSPYADPSSYDPSDCLATGWGKDAFDEGNYQTTLKRVDLTLIERNECEKRLRETKLGPKFKLHASFICAGGQPGYDTCQGDGGGPLVCASVDNPNRYIQVGIVSWGIRCASNLPGVYTSLYANREWLASKFNSTSDFKIGNPDSPVLPSSTVNPSSKIPRLIETPSSIATSIRTPELSITEPPQTVIPRFLLKMGTKSTEQQECGIINRSVANQTAASENNPESLIDEFPWMTLILTTNIKPDGSRIENVIVCGASLVSTSVVLTAAHCVDDQNKNLLKVRVGEHNFGASISGPMNYQDRSVSRILLHNEFNHESLYNDLALIRVTEDFDFTPPVSPICLPLTNSFYADPSSYNPASCFVTGWEKHALDGRYQPILRKVDLPLVPRDKCQERLRKTVLGKHFKLHSSFVCAGGEMNSDTCKGDGGGPLVCASRDNPNKYIQVGVVSWGIECGSDIPGVYGSLEANREWLTDEFNKMKAV